MKIFKKRNILGVFVCSFLFFSCNGNKTKKENSNLSSSKILKINIASEPHTLDPRKARTLNDFNILKMFMEGLIRIDPHSEAKLSLCSKYDISKDLKTYTFTLRNTKWSNNSTVTADDFVYTYKTLLAPDFPAGQANLLYVIKNAEKIKKGLLPVSALGVIAKDPKTLVIELENPTPYFLELLATPCFFPICAAVDKKDPHSFNNAATFVSCGPFKIKKWKHNDQIIAEKNQRYWDASSVQLQGLSLVMLDAETGLNMFENKELDLEGSPLSTLPLDAISSLKKLGKLYSKSILGTSFLRTNIERGPLNSLNFRKALAYSLDREEINQAIFHGESTIATGFVPSSFKFQERPYFDDFDVESAKNYLDISLEKGEISQKDLNSLTLSYISRDRNHRLAQILQDKWKKTLNINISLRPIESKVFFDKIRKKDFDLAISSWEADFNDPVNFLEVFRSKETATNNTNWESKIYLDLLNQSYQVLDSGQRIELLKKCEKILIDEMPIIPLCEYSMFYVKDPKVKNVAFSNMGGIDFKWAFVDKEFIRG